MRKVTIGRGPAGGSSHEPAAALAEADFEPGASRPCSRRPSLARPEEECGGRFAEHGVDVLKVQQLMGHASTTTTHRYFTATSETGGDAMRQAMGWQQESA